MARMARPIALLTVLALAVLSASCSTSSADTSTPPEPVSQGLVLVEPTTPEDKAFLQAFEASNQRPDYAWTAIPVDDIPQNLIPADTLGRDLLAVAVRPPDPSGETTSGEPAYVKMLFEGGLFIQASTEDSIRPNAIILSDHAQEMATQSAYSFVQTATVAGTLGLATVGELPPEWFAAGWVAVRNGTAIQWADDEWFYNIWITDSEDAEAVLTVARSMGG